MKVSVSKLFIGVYVYKLMCVHMTHTNHKAHNLILGGQSVNKILNIKPIILFYKLFH